MKNILYILLLLLPLFNIAQTDQSNFGGEIEVKGDDLYVKDYIVSTTKSLQIAQVHWDSTVTTGDTTKYFAMIDASYDGYSLYDVGVRCKTVGAGTVTVNLYKDSLGTVRQLTSTGVTLTNERYANDEVVNASYSTVYEGGLIFAVITLTSTAPKGLTISTLWRKD